MTILIINIFAATLMLSILLALLGSLVLWQDYTFFSDGLVHSCMLITSIMFLLNIPLFLASVVVAGLYSGLVFILKSNNDKSTAIVVISNGLLAVAVIISNLIPESGALNKLLFGNILSADLYDIMYLISLLIIAFSFLYFNYKKLIITSLNKELAFVMGFRPKILELVFLIILSTVIIISIKIFGGILLTALLIIPSATARIFSKSAISMIILSIFIASAINIMSLAVSFYVNLAPTATIIVANVLAFLLANLYLGIKKSSSLSRL